MTPLKKKTEARRLVDELIAKGLTRDEICAILGAAFVAEHYSTDGSHRHRQRRGYPS